MGEILSRLYRNSKINLPRDSREWTISGSKNFSIVKFWGKKQQYLFMIFYSANGQQSENK